MRIAARKYRPCVVRLIQEASGKKSKKKKPNTMSISPTTDCVSECARACVLSVCTCACCFATHIWSGPKNQRLWLSNIALRFPNLRQLATVSRRWFIGWREGHFPSQSHRTFMVCSHPNLLQINLSPGSVWASAVSADNRQVCARTHTNTKSVFPAWEKEPDWTKF